MMSGQGACFMKNNEKNGRKSVCLHKKMLTADKSYVTMKPIHDTYHEEDRETTRALALQEAHGLAGNGLNAFSGLLHLTE